MVKEKIRLAYEAGTVDQMKAELKEIIELCEATENKHFQWFSKLIKRHFDGMAAHAKFRLSNSKIEGINNKIKTLRRQGYGYTDDEYFSSRSSMPAERSTSGTRHHTEKMIELCFIRHGASVL